MPEKRYDVELLVWSYNDDEFQRIFRRCGLTAEETIELIVSELSIGTAAWRVTPSKEEPQCQG